MPSSPRSNFGIRSRLNLTRGCFGDAIGDEADERIRAHAAERELPGAGMPLLTFQPGQKGEKQDQQNLDAFRRQQLIEIGEHKSVQAYPISAQRAEWGGVAIGLAPAAYG